MRTRPTDFIFTVGIVFGVLQTLPPAQASQKDFDFCVRKCFGDGHQCRLEVEADAIVKHGMDAGPQLDAMVVA